MYEPYEYTNDKINNGKFSYPGIIKEKNWNKAELKKYMQAVVYFQKRNNIPSNKILVGEFGGNRFVAGVDKYFDDLMQIFNEEKWHFAFYAFREDTWDGMDYELGNKKLGAKYWLDMEKYLKNQDKKNLKKPAPQRDDKNNIFRVIRKYFNN